MVCNYESSENRKGNPSGHGNRQGLLNEVPKAYETKQHMQTGECKTEKSFGTGQDIRNQETMTGWEKIIELICLIMGEQSEYSRSSKTQFETE